MTTRRGQRYEIPIAQEQDASAIPDLAGRSSQFGSLEQDSGVNSFIEKFKEVAHVADEKLGEIGHPLKPYLPVVGRLLVISTFLEDVWRILTQWSSQVRYIWQIRGLPWILTILFLVANVSLMLSGSYLVMSKRKLEWGVGFLTGVIVSQAIVYGLIWDLRFFCRNLSLIGGLLLIVSDIFAQDRRSALLPGLLRFDTQDRSQNIVLTGRILLVLIYVAHLLRARWSIGGSFLNLAGLAAVVLVVIGFKARFSASLLAVLLLGQNIVTNSYWRLSSSNPNRDFLRYEYFQTLSIVGGLILLVNMGAGTYSIDEKKKIY